MVIISTSAVAEIIQAVSPASIFGGRVPSRRSAGTQPSAMRNEAAMPQSARTGDAFVVINSPLGRTPVVGVDSRRDQR